MGMSNQKGHFGRRMGLPPDCDSLCHRIEYRVVQAAVIGNPTLAFAINPAKLYCLVLPDEIIVCLVETQMEERVPLFYLCAGCVDLFSDFILRNREKLISCGTF